MMTKLARKSWMKKFFFAAALSAAACLLFAQEGSPASQAQIKFVKGNISDKIAAVKSSGDGELAKKAVDFVVENALLLKGDRDLAGLAVAGILSYPAEEYKKRRREAPCPCDSIVAASGAVCD